MSPFLISDETPLSDAASGDLAVLSVGGEVDYEASPRLRAGIDEHIKAGRRRIVLDLSGATFIDSTAIGVLVTAVVRLRESGGGSLGVVCRHENVLQIFRITSLDLMVTLYGSRDEALSALVPAG
jgi:anti-sigma B factor antagonist